MEEHAEHDQQRPERLVPEQGPEDQLHHEDAPGERRNDPDAVDEHVKLSEPLEIL